MTHPDSDRPAPSGTFCRRTRREFLWEAGAGFTGLALSGLLGTEGFFTRAAGAADAARQIMTNGALPAHTLVLMVSCIGRRLLMGQHTIDEVDAVRDEIGDYPVGLGFYSYGEICPHDQSGRGEMHNQTMTITAISEAA